MQAYNSRTTEYEVYNRKIVIILHRTDDSSDLFSKAFMIEKQ